MNLEKNPTSPMKNDHSIKKAKLRTQGEDGDNPKQLSFRDKLMEWQKPIENELVGREDDLIFDPKDIVIDSVDNLPSISFSQKVHVN